MRVPTVRVVNPADPGRFMIINAADHQAEVHALWPEQEAGFNPASLERSAATVPLDPVQTLDPALRDAAAALCLRMVALRRRVEGEPFVELSTIEQLTVVQEMLAEVGRAEVAFEEDQLDRAAYEASERERAAAELVLTLSDAGNGDAAETPSADDEAPSKTGLRVAKGPGGRWYVCRGDERVSRGFASEDEAAAEVARVTAEAAAA